MAGIALVHVQRDRRAQLALCNIVAAEIEGAWPRSVGFASHIAGGKVELFTVGFVRFDTQFGLWNAQEQLIHQRIDPFGDVIPRGLQIRLAGIGFTRTPCGLRFRFLDRSVDARDFGETGVVDLLRGQREGRVILDAIGIVSFAAGIVGSSNACARLRQIFVGQIIPQLLERRHQRAGKYLAMLLRQPFLFGLRNAVGEICNRRPVGTFFDRRIELKIELFDHQFYRHARQSDARCGASLEARDRLIDDLRHFTVTAEIVFVVLDGVVRHERAGRGKTRVEHMHPAEMIDRQRKHGGQYLGRGHRQRPLLGVFEDIVGDAIGFAQSIAVNGRQFGQIRLRSGALFGVAGGREISQLVRIGKVPAKEGGNGIAIERFGFAALEKCMQFGSIVFAGRHAGMVPRMILCEGRHGHGGAGDGDRRCEAAEITAH